jgi:uridine kinase
MAAVYSRVVSVDREVERPEAVATIADLIDGMPLGHPVRVAIDGPDAAGKTTLGDELGSVLRDRGREVIRASIDGFHRPRTVRYRQGAKSPLGYYDDSFDYAQLRQELLRPLGAGGDRLYRTRVFDYRSDQPVEARRQRAGDHAVLIFDGVFLLRPELANAWDVRVFVTAAFDEILRPVRTRDVELFGSSDEAEQRYRAR